MVRRLDVSCLVGADSDGLSAGFGPLSRWLAGIAERDLSCLGDGDCLFLRLVAIMLFSFEGRLLAVCCSLRRLESGLLDTFRFG